MTETYKCSVTDLMRAYDAAHPDMNVTTMDDVHEWAIGQDLVNVVEVSKKTGGKTLTIVTAGDIYAGTDNITDNSTDTD